LEIDALKGAPGVHSARYAAEKPDQAHSNTDDAANNARVLRELQGVPPDQRTSRFVCVLAAARDGKTLATFRGTAKESSSTRRAARMASATIRCFIFLRSRKHLRS
jgi:XTP/dITP diphosphohydrolase